VVAIVGLLILMPLARVGAKRSSEHAGKNNYFRSSESGQTR
jgi:hypothetical protein